MTLKELKSGAKFKYSHGSYYSVEHISDGSWIICQFNHYLASITKMTAKYVYAYTYIMDQKVDLKINIEQCIDMKKEEEKNKEYQLQEMQDEYGIGAYEE